MAAPPVNSSLGRMSRSKLALAIGLVALVAALYALAPTLVTIATNDPHRYQRLLRQSLIAAALATSASLLFFFLATGRTRLSVVVPALITAWAVYRTWQLWPYAFG
jgi:hypothetical protein